MSSYWYALWVKPHKETTVFQQLQAREVDGYLPMVRVNPKNPRAAKYRPYFPGYMFVYADLEQLGDNYFRWLPGTRGLVGFDGEPSIVPVEMVRWLEKRISEIDKAGGLVFDTLKQGDPVLITSGPFSGLEAVFDKQLSGNERVQVLLKFLSNYPQRVQLDSADIEKRKPAIHK
ncbi:MAG TPA: hypothetical protein ENJ56_01040 [Anaerolineae bacterium]|nr:hypothetical protein [Anaerolineae bacterium]